MDFLKKHGEKILLLVLALVLAGSVVVALGMVGGMENPKKRTLAPPPGNASVQVEALDKVLERLTGTAPTVEVSTVSFTPEARVICMFDEGERRLIPADADICPFCGQPQKVKIRDTDGDGIPDNKENEWGMDPMEPSDAFKDLDGDGFPVLYEYHKDTNPRDSDSYPDLIDFLRLVDIQESSIRFELRGTAKLGETYTLQLHWVYPGETRGTTAYVRVGRKFGRNNEFLADSFTEKRTLQGNKYVDESIAVIRSGRHTLELGRRRENRSGSITESAATLKLIFGPEWEETVRVDQTIELGKKSYMVVDIGREAVVLQPNADSEPATAPIVVARATSEDDAALEKYRSDSAPGTGGGLSGDGETDMMGNGLFLPEDFR